MKRHTFLVTLLIALSFPVVASVQKTPITAADQLPRRTYQLKGSVTEILLNGEIVRAPFRQPVPARTLESSKFYASMFRDAVSYFKAQGVRIVNMSWRYAVSTIEATLTANNIGKDAQERITGSILRLAVMSMAVAFFVVGIEENLRSK